MIYTAGWKAPSLVDVRGRVSFTVWLCGCNLRCPYCHNHRVANGDPRICRMLNVDKLLEAVKGAARVVEYIHVTGGEPLLQHRGLARLLAGAKKLELYSSVATNCTLPERLKQVVNLLDHAAVDLKVPREDHPGLPPDMLREKQLECLRVLAEHKVTVELRIPLQKPRPGYFRLLEEAVMEAAEKLRGTKWYIVVIPLVSEPIASPRDPEWCEVHCNPGHSVIQSVIRNLKEKLERFDVMVYAAPHAVV